MENVCQNYPADEIKPPVTQVGVVGWIRTNLFKGLVKLHIDPDNGLFFVDNCSAADSLGIY